MLEREILKKINIKDYEIVRQFKSKKNKVFLIKAVMSDNRMREFVLKEQKHNFQKETDILLKLKKGGVNVPSLCYSAPGYIILEYIPGPTLLDCLCRLEEKQAGLPGVIPIFIRLTYWLKEFYRLMERDGSIILGDQNYRNFILYNGETVYGVDFEDYRQGPVEEDIGRLCAFGLTYRPEFTEWKLKTYKFIFHYLVEALDLDFKLAGFYLKDELRSINKRRGLELPDDPVLTVLLSDL